MAPEEVKLRLEETRDGDWGMSVLRKSINKLITARERNEELRNDVDVETQYQYSGDSLFQAG